MKNLQNKKRGFTLIETLVAIAIFAFAITGLISVTANGIFDTNFVKNKLTASYLALEGAELVRNIRDTASIDNVPWSTILLPETDLYLGRCIKTDDDQSCAIDPWTESVASCPSGICPALTYNTDNGQFSYETQNNSNLLSSIFVRKIQIELIDPLIPPPHEARVTSEVKWMQGTREHKVVYSYNLLDWAGP